MHIGIIGGIGPAATDLYYRALITAMRAQGVPLEVTIAHCDSVTLLAHFEARAPELQVPIYVALAERLKAAGAEVLVISSIGGHFCIDEFRAVSPLPVLDMIAVMNAHMAGPGYARVGLLGTDTVMASRFYGGLTEVEVLIPPSDDIPRLHRFYADMATSGVVTDAARDAFFEAGRAMVARGAETVLLGGTDLFLAFDGADPGFATLDCALVHVEAIVEAACG